METLPIEMTLKIAQHLTPQDLARCSAVCHGWHDMFNQDSLWKPHCDPDLEEHLRTTRSTATPAFVAPEASENSGFSPACRWKLAYMRETHLWNNWKRKETIDYKRENSMQIANHDIMGVDFLTDTLIVVWYRDFIEIFDVTGTKAVSFAKTYTKIAAGDRCSVIGTTMLLVEKKIFVNVFSVDIVGKSINLRHIIYTLRNKARAVKENLYLTVKGEFKLLIFDIISGNMLKKERLSLKVNEDERVFQSSITSSETSDFVAIGFEVIPICTCRYIKYLIYNVKQLTFVSGEDIKAKHCMSIGLGQIVLHGRWMALTDNLTLKMYNIQTNSCYTLSYKISFDWPFSIIFIKQYNRKVVYVYCSCLIKTCIKVYSSSSRTFTTLCDYPDMKVPHVISYNGKLIAIFHFGSRISTGVWKFSGPMVEKCAFSVETGCKANRSFTKVYHPPMRHAPSVCEIISLW